MKTSIKLLIAFVLAAIALIGVTCMKMAYEYNKIKATMPTSETGVWASDNFELVRTKNMSIIFTNQGGQKAASLIKFAPYGEDSVLVNTICKVVFDSTRVISKEILTNIDSVMDTRCVGKKVDHLLILHIGSGRTSSKRSYASYRLHLVEQLESSNKPEFFSANANNIGDCLQQWGLGSKFETDGSQVSAQIATNRHTYTYIVTSDMIYCRAARIRSNNKGTCFAQNIRLMNNANEHTAMFADNNMELTSSELILDSTKFDTTRCVFAEQGIYWSLMKFSSDEILIHGCGGETYKYSPKSNKMEYFKFCKY